MPVDPLADPEDVIRRLYAYVAYRIGPGPDAEDVVSESIERALRYRDRYLPSLGTPMAWMIGIANSCLADAMRDAGRRTGDDVESLLGSVGDFAGDVAARSDLYAAVVQLDPRDRELVALRYGADLRVREIADVLGKRTNAVEVALHRCLERLRRKLEAPTATAPAATTARPGVGSGLGDDVHRAGA